MAEMKPERSRSVGGYRTVCTALLFVIIANSCVAGAEAVQAQRVPLKGPVSQSGTISFILRTDRHYRNGKGQENYAQTLVALPGINAVSFRRTDQVVNLRLTWEAASGPVIHDIIVDFPDLPGPQDYFVQFTWDSARGLSQGYLNGTPLRIPGCRFEPWWVANAADHALVFDGRLTVDDVLVTAGHLSQEEAVAAVPLQYRERNAGLIGHAQPPVPIPVAALRGKLLYESRMDDPAALEGWVAEGPLHVEYENGGALMRSKAFEGHTVLWCPEEFPDRFVAEWEFQPLAHYGLAIVFFAATGEHGEDIFDSALPPRDGTFGQYTKGSIKSYHVSYFANVRDFQMGRIDSNLRKNNGFYRVGGGPVAIEPGAQGWQLIRLVKQGGHIQLSCNGRTFVDWIDDDPERYGPRLREGKIGLRQMTPTIGCYRNFRVWELAP
jgi:hypothetical protein